MCNGLGLDPSTAICKQGSWGSPNFKKRQCSLPGMFPRSYLRLCRSKVGHVSVYTARPSNEHSACQPPSPFILVINFTTNGSVVSEHALKEVAFDRGCRRERACPSL